MKLSLKVKAGTCEFRLDFAFIHMGREDSFHVHLVAHRIPLDEFMHSEQIQLILFLGEPLVLNIVFFCQ